MTVANENESLNSPSTEGYPNSKWSYVPLLILAPYTVVLRFLISTPYLPPLFIITFSILRSSFLQINSFNS